VDELTDSNVSEKPSSEPKALRTEGFIDQPTREWWGLDEGCSGERIGLGGNTTIYNGNKSANVFDFNLLVFERRDLSYYTS
jgi:hypothetical protein